MAGCATPTGSTGHAPRGATSNPELTFNPDHPAGADQPAAGYGDNVYHGLNRDLGFTDADWVENVGRVAEVARLMAKAGLIVLVSLISPSGREREMAREVAGELEFVEIFVDTPLAVCEARDPNGLYAKARAGQSRNFTSIGSAFEPPEIPNPASTEARRIGKYSN